MILNRILALDYVIGRRDSPLPTQAALRQRRSGPLLLNRECASYLRPSIARKYFLLLTMPMHELRYLAK
jgi:hypothetical protein